MASPQSSDEGEIIESVEDLKSTTTRASGRNGVDRQDRLRSPPRSPGYDRAYGRDSRSPRGHKRPRDDRDFRDQTGSRGGDPRRFRVHYEDSRGGYRRGRGNYHDLDRPTQPNAFNGRYRDSDRDRDRSRDRGNRGRDAYPEKRQRTRSRSPYRRDARREDRYRRGDQRSNRHGGSSPRHVMYDDHLDRDSRTDLAFRRAGQGEAPRSPRTDAKPHKGSSDERRQSQKDDASGPDQCVPTRSFVLPFISLCVMF